MPARHNTDLITYIYIYVYNLSKRRERDVSRDLANPHIGNNQQNATTQQQRPIGETQLMLAVFRNEDTHRWDELLEDYPNVSQIELFLSQIELDVQPD